MWPEWLQTCRPCPLQWWTVVQTPACVLGFISLQLHLLSLTSLCSICRQTCVFDATGEQRVNMQRADGHRPL